ncbi:MAG: dephospho-CoA kinase [Verrucomicrobiota bacterium]
MGSGAKRLALTGGIGCGKSAVADLLQKDGFRIVDTDLMARMVVEPGQEGYEKVIDAFGNSILNSDGTIHRGRLGQIVFSDPSRRDQLNSLLHPIIRKQWQMRQYESWETFPSVPVVVVIPLLFEAGLESEFDSIACVACSRQIQWERLSARGLSSEQIEQRLKAQMNLERKMELARYVVWNDSSLALLERLTSELAFKWRPGERKTFVNKKENHV